MRSAAREDFGRPVAVNKDKIAVPVPPGKDGERIALGLRSRNRIFALLQRGLLRCLFICYIPAYRLIFGNRSGKDLRLRDHSTAATVLYHPGIMILCSILYDRVDPGLWMQRTVSHAPDLRQGILGRNRCPTRSSRFRLKYRE